MDSKSLFRLLIRICVTCNITWVIVRLSPLSNCSSKGRNVTGAASLSLCPRVSRRTFTRSLGYHLAPLACPDTLLPPPTRSRFTIKPLVLRLATGGGGASRGEGRSQGSALPAHWAINVLCFVPRGRRLRHPATRPLTELSRLFRLSRRHLDVAGVRQSLFKCSPCL